ncbi:MAG TPA: hypothetical protein DCE41_12185, partial [Cytophagales bacterium]|nr:hypothetical protein [Cytophagales bacterium]HAP60771.1 hypothetical protein [Cytophagales bacterium]
MKKQIKLSPRGTQVLLALGLMVGLLAYSQTVQAQTWDGSVSSGDTKELFPINQNRTFQDAGIRLNAGVISGGTNKYRDWMLWTDGNNNKLYFGYYNYETTGLLGSGANMTSITHNTYALGTGGIFTINSPSTSNKASVELRRNGGNVFRFSQETNGDGYVWHHGNEPIRFGTNNSERVRITNAGLVGIGIVDPQDQLDVKDAIRITDNVDANDYVTLGHGGTNAYLNYAGGGNLDFRFNEGTLIQMTSAGKFGIGGDFDPGYMLEVRGDGYFDTDLTVDGILRADTLLKAAAVVFDNVEGDEYFGTTPTEGTLMYDANWQDADTEYNWTNYFNTATTGEDINIGGFSQYVRNASSEWEHLLSTYNMRYLKADLYSLDVENGLVVSGSSVLNNGLTVSGTSTFDNWITLARPGTGTETARFDLKAGGLTNGLRLGIHNDAGREGQAFLWNVENGPLMFGTNHTDRMQIAADGKVSIGNKTFNAANTYQLGVDGTGYFSGDLSTNAALSVAGTTNLTGNVTIGTSTTNTADLEVRGQAKVYELQISPTGNWADYVFA